MNGRRKSRSFWAHVVASKRDSRLVVDPIHARVVRGGCKSDPRPYWRSVVYRDATEVTVWTGRATKEELREILLEKVRNGELDPQDPNAGPVVTVGNLLSRWVGGLLEELGKTDGTFKAYRGRARALTKTIGEVRLDRVSPATLQDHAATRGAQGIRSTTIGNDLVAFGAAWRWGFELGLVALRDPPRALPSKRRRRGRRREGETAQVSDARPKYTPTAAEVALILAHLTGWSRTVGLIASTTGMRVGEIANLEWRDVDFDRLTIHIRDVPGAKTGERTTPIPPDLVAELRALKPSNAHPEDSVSGRAVSTVITRWTKRFLPRACKAAGVPRVTAHAFRRYMTRVHADRGVDVLVSAEMMGNSPEVQWRSYREVTPEDMQAALKRARVRIPTTGKVVPFRRAKGSKGEE